MGRKIKDSLLIRIGEKVMAFDKYGESASLSVDGKSTFPSIYGMIISILILLVAVPYGANKFVIMLGREDTSF